MTTPPFRFAAALLALYPLLAYSGEGAQQRFPYGRFTTVVNTVEVIDAAAKATPAATGTPVVPGDLVRTARKSRAQISLTDGTLVRLGPNAVFTFDEDTRTLHLKRGAVLFHAPHGAGGGTLVTNSATASVIGTTLVVSVEDTGDYECLVLEGACEATWKTTKVRVPAGGMVHKGAAGAGKPAATGEFSHAAFLERSALIAGFDAPLPSAAAITAARCACDAGRAKDTPMMTPSACSMGAE